MVDGNEAGINNYCKLINDALQETNDSGSIYYEINNDVINPTNNPYLINTRKAGEVVDCFTLQDLYNNKNLVCSKPYVYCGRRSIIEDANRTDRTLRKGKKGEGEGVYFIPGTKVKRGNDNLEAVNLGHEVIFVSTNKTLKGDDLITEYENEKNAAFSHIIEVLKNPGTDEYTKLNSLFNDIYSKYMDMEYDKKTAMSLTYNKLAMLYKPFGNSSNPNVGVRMIQLRRCGVNVSDLFKLTQTENGTNNMTIDGYHQSIRMFTSL